MQGQAADIEATESAKVADAQKRAADQLVQQKAALDTKRAETQQLLDAHVQNATEAARAKAASRAEIAGRDRS